MRATGQYVDGHVWYVFERIEGKLEVELSLLVILR
jgi:hypothetical protein